MTKYLCSFSHNFDDTDIFIPIRLSRFWHCWTQYFQMAHIMSSLTGTVSDFNTFLWYKSEDMNKKRLFPKFQLIQILLLQVMHDYVHWHCSIDYCVKCTFTIQVHWANDHFKSCVSDIICFDILFFINYEYRKNFCPLFGCTHPHKYHINGSQLAKMKKSIPDMSLP